MVDNTMELLPRTGGIEISGHKFHGVVDHELQTPNEGINLRNLKNWADMADKICFGRT